MYFDVDYYQPTSFPFTQFISEFVANFTTFLRETRGVELSPENFKFTGSLDANGAAPWEPGFNGKFSFHLRINRKSREELIESIRIKNDQLAQLRTDLKGWKEKMRRWGVDDRDVRKLVRMYAEIRPKLRGLGVPDIVELALYALKSPHFDVKGDHMLQYKICCTQFRMHCLDNVEGRAGAKLFSQEERDFFTYLYASIPNSRIVFDAFRGDGFSQDAEFANLPKCNPRRFRGALYIPSARTARDWVSKLAPKVVKTIDPDRTQTIVDLVEEVDEKKAPVEVHYVASIDEIAEISVLLRNIAKQTKYLKEGDYGFDLGGPGARVIMDFIGELWSKADALRVSVKSALESEQKEHTRVKEAIARSVEDRKSRGDLNAKQTPNQAKTLNVREHREARLRHLLDQADQVYMLVVVAGCCV
ncbi:hypothetical protein HK102_005443 [Quaeritorhiza haematococci]|nr:hypothetical protein HK102_005443 [Quaeritorhiza haematococci]